MVPMGTGLGIKSELPAWAMKCSTSITGRATSQYVASLQARLISRIKAYAAMPAPVFPRVESLACSEAAYWLVARPVMDVEFFLAQASNPGATPGPVPLGTIWHLEFLAKNLSITAIVGRWPSFWCCRRS